jgi:hypothetical protein
MSRFFIPPNLADLECLHASQYVWMLAIELLEIHRREIVHSAVEVDVVDILVFVDAEGSAEDFAGLLAAQDELNGKMFHKGVCL